MDSTYILNRIRRIEQRLEQVERNSLGFVAPPQRPPTTELRGVGAPAAEPAGRTEMTPTPLSAPRPIQPPLPAQADTTPRAPAPATTPRSPVEWERFFGMAVLGRIGVGAVLLAAGYFAQLAYRGLPDIARVACIYALAAAFVGVGAYVRDRTRTRYVAMLWGGGAAAAYLAGVSAHLRYGLVSSEVALVLLALASALGQGLARKLAHATLASVALAGAFAAPLLVSPVINHPTFLLIYLGALHLWAAWMQQAWGWAIPRRVALAGVGVVAGTWLIGAGAVDAPTYAHVSGYMILLVWPELARAARGQPLTEPTQSAVIAVVAAISGILFGVTFGDVAMNADLLDAASHLALPAFGLIAGATWLATSTWLAHAGGCKQNRELVIGLAHTGGLLLVLAVWGISVFGPTWLGLESADAARLAGAVLLGVIATGLLLHAHVIGAGQAAASLAIGLMTCMTVLEPSTPHAIWLGLAGATAAAGMFFLARDEATRQVALWTGLLSLATGLARTTDWGDGYVLIPFAACALWVALTLFVARLRRDRALADQGLVAIVLLGALWGAFAFVGTYTNVTFPVLDPMTLSGLALAAVALFGCVWMMRWNPTGAKIRAVLWGLFGVVTLLIIGHRETASAVAGLPGATQAALHIAYLCLTAWAVVWVGERRKAGALVVVGLVLLGIALLNMLLDVTLPAGGLWPSIALLLPLATTWLMDAPLDRRFPQARAALPWASLIVALAWFGYAMEARFPVGPLLLNLRTLTGLAILGGGLALGHAHVQRVGPRDTALVRLVWMLPLAYLVGLLELLDLTEPMAAEWARVLVSVYTTLFAAALLTLGFTRQDERLRYPALALFGCVLLKITLYDLGGVAIPLRILVTGVLGLVLLGAAFAYARTGTGGGHPSETQDAPLQVD